MDFAKLLTLFVILLIQILVIVQPATVDILLIRIKFAKNLISQMLIPYVLNGIKIFVQNVPKAPISVTMDYALLLIHHAKLQTLILVFVQAAIMDINLTVQANV